MSWYRTGTVAVTNGSKNVTGTGTLWASSVNVGDAFALVDANLNPTGAWYEVETVTSNTAIVLKQSYAGTTGSNKTYCVFNLVGNMTTPSFAQRLAQFFDQFQNLVDLPTTTPTAASIPIADGSGKIDSAWIKDASATVKGAVELATAAEAAAGNDTTRAITPSVSGSRTTFAVTSTDDATSATDAPLKSAGGLAVAKKVYVGATSVTSVVGGINLGDLKVKAESFTLDAGATKEIQCLGGMVYIYVPSTGFGGLFFLDYANSTATRLAGIGEITDTGSTFALLGTAASSAWQLKNKAATSTIYRTFTVNV